MDDPKPHPARNRRITTSQMRSNRPRILEIVSLRSLEDSLILQYLFVWAFLLFSTEYPVALAPALHGGTPIGMNSTSCWAWGTIGGAQSSLPLFSRLLSLAGCHLCRYVGNRYICLINVPFSYSSKASRSSSCVFMTIGPYQATGSPIGRPDTRRKRTDFSWVVMITWSPSP